MPKKPEIEKIRILHDIRSNFALSDTVKATLESQLSGADRQLVERFSVGFTIEDWFAWTFSAMPWVILIHGLSQQQFPNRSKGKYQVPDFLVLVETSALSHQPLLIEVKSVPFHKRTLKVQSSQMVLCENYAAALGIPIVYAVFWKQFDAWTLNTPDTFRHCSSVRKLTIIDAIEHDCGSILGDVSYLMSQSLTRVSTYIKDGESESGVQHEDYGRLVSDLAILGENRIEMSSVESAAIDSVAMSRRSSIATESGRTELIEAPDGNHMLKLSSWITRHLSKFGETPTVQNAAVSAHIISGLMEKLRVELIHVMFPAEKSAELERLRTLFMGKT